MQKKEVCTREYALTHVLVVRILEIQAEGIVRRYPQMRIASLRPTWVVPTRETAMKDDRPKDLWAWVGLDETADAFLRGLTAPEGAWTGHEAFFIMAPTLTSDKDFNSLHQSTYPDVPLKPGKWDAFFDCSKAERLLGWTHAK